MGLFVPALSRVWSSAIGKSATAALVFAVVAGMAASVFLPGPQPRPAPAQVIAGGKSFDRLTWEVEEIPTRATRTYDSVAMFALPSVEPAPWSEQAVAKAPSAGAAKAAQEPVRTAILPPSRPAIREVAGATAAADKGQAAVQVAEIEPVSRPISILGLEVPGTERITPLVPDGRSVMKRAAEFGGKVSAIGHGLAEAVGLR